MNAGPCAVTDPADLGMLAAAALLVGISLIGPRGTDARVLQIGIDPREHAPHRPVSPRRRPADAQDAARYCAPG